MKTKTKLSNFCSNNCPLHTMKICNQANSKSIIARSIKLGQLIDYLVKVLKRFFILLKVLALGENIMKKRSFGPLYYNNFWKFRVRVWPCSAVRLKVRPQNNFYVLQIICGDLAMHFFSPFFLICRFRKSSCQLTMKECPLSTYELTCALTLFMPPTLKKWGAYCFRLDMSVCLSVRPFKKI